MLWEEVKCGPASRQFSQSSGSTACGLQELAAWHCWFAQDTRYPALDKPLPSRSYNLHPREPTFQSRVVTQGSRCTPKLNEPSKLLQQPIQRSKNSQFDSKRQWAHRAWLSAEVAHTHEVYLPRSPQPDGSHMQYSVRSCRDS